MNPGTGTPQQPKLTTVKCEKHGLRYNPNIHTGCVRCRKEAGEAIATASLPRPTTMPSGAFPGGRTESRLLPSLAVTALLIGATGSAFYWAHQHAVEANGGVQGLASRFGVDSNELAGDELAGEEMAGEEASFEDFVEDRADDGGDGELSEEDGKMVDR